MECPHAAGHHRDVDSFSILPLSSRGANIERAQLRCSFQAVTLRQATALAVELRAMAASTPRVRSVAAAPSQLRCWIVTATTLPMPMPLTLTVLRRWEAELLAIEQRWSGCCFLGWRTSTTPPDRPVVPGEQRERAGAGEMSSPRPSESAGTNSQTSQRQLVIASLLRHPSGPSGPYAAGVPRGAARR
jgi:hypothetical protein